MDTASSHDMLVVLFKFCLGVNILVLQRRDVSFWYCNQVMVTVASLVMEDVEQRAFSYYFSHPS